MTVTVLQLQQAIEAVPDLEGAQKSVTIAFWQANWKCQIKRWHNWALGEMSEEI